MLTPKSYWLQLIWEMIIFYLFKVISLVQCAHSRISRSDAEIPRMYLTGSVTAGQTVSQIEIKFLRWWIQWLIWQMSWLVNSKKSITDWTKCWKTLTIWWPGFHGRGFPGGLVTTVGCESGSLKARYPDMIDKDSYDVIYAEDYLDQYSDRLEISTRKFFRKFFRFFSSKIQKFKLREI